MGSFVQQSTQAKAPKPPSPNVHTPFKEGDAAQAVLVITVCNVG